MVIGSLNFQVSHFFSMATNIVTKSLFTWRWGTPGMPGHDLSFLVMFT